jgi:2-polyprenyl-6-methoxyphenol hydroxylase-like FAD-dependent oxidoreductase
MAITVVGAGLTGSMIATLLAQSGNRITLIEKRRHARSDPLSQPYQTAHVVNPNKRHVYYLC